MFDNKKERLKVKKYCKLLFIFTNYLLNYFYNISNEWYISVNKTDLTKSGRVPKPNSRFVTEYSDTSSNEENDRKRKRADDVSIILSMHL